MHSAIFLNALLHMVLCYAGGPNLKALYRRGQARLHLRSFRLATQDLQQAADLCPSGDFAQLDLIMARLSDAKQGQAESGDGASEPKRYNDGSVTIEQVLPDAAAQTKAAFTAGQKVNASTSSGHASSVAARARLNAMCNMPEEQLRRTAREAGMPEIDGKTAKQVNHFTPDSYVHLNGLVLSL